MVYSLKSDSSIRVLDHVLITFDCRRGDGLFFNGNLHWVNDTMPDDRPLPIVSFNLSTHCFGEVPVPVTKIDMSSYCFMYVGVLDGCLCILVNHVYESEILVMKEYGVVESWAKLLRVGKARLPGAMERTIAFTRSRKELLVRLSLFRVASIDMENMVVEDVSPFSNPPRRYDAAVCVENLLMLDCFSDLLESEQHGVENTRKRRRPRERGRRNKRN